MRCAGTTHAANGTRQGTKQSKEHLIPSEEAAATSTTDSGREGEGGDGFGFCRLRGESD